MQDKITIKIPDGIVNDIDLCLSEHPPKFKYIRDNFLYLVGKIFYIPTHNPDLQGMRLIPIYSKIIREEIGIDYKKYFEYLLNWEFLITDNYYVPSKLNPAGWGKCKCYGYTDKYFGRSIVKYEIKKNSLIKRMKRWNKKTIEKVKNDPILYQHKTFLDKITFDFEGAIVKLKLLFDNKELTRTQYDIEIDRCEKIRDKNFYIVRDDAGRIHTNLTNISKVIREEFLYIDGVKTTGLDIKSCQPALLYTLLHDYMGEIKENHTNKYKISQFSIGKSISDSRNRYLSSENKILKEKSNYDLPLDVSLFGYNNFEHFEHDFIKEMSELRRVLETDIYENIRKWFKSNFDVEKTRKQAKKFFFSYVFGRYNRKKSRMQQVWEEEFPLLDRMISYIKNPDYKFLAYKLQKKESEIVIDGLCSEINKLLDIPYFTVHDSIYSSPENLIKIKPIFEKILLENNVITELI